MDDTERLREKLDGLRRRSEVLLPSAPSPQTHIEQIALDAWDRADELAEGVQRLVTPPARTRSCSILARALWEDLITLAYIAKRPVTRIRQARASLVRDYKDLARAPWSRDLQFAPMPDEGVQFLKQRREAER